MDVTKTFRQLVTNQYMPYFDYNNTEFTFQTVYHQAAHSYCFCPCGFEHEYLDYIADSGEINEEIYEKVLQCIIDGKCPHVDNVAENYVHGASVYGVHIAAAVGTNKALTSPLDRIALTEKTSGLLTLNPYQIALIKNPAVASKINQNEFSLSERMTIVHANRLSNKRTSKIKIQLEEQTGVEYCARKRVTSSSELYIQTTVSDKDFINTLQVAFKYELVDLQELLKRKWNRMHVEDILGECCTLAIVYDQPEFLFFLLHHPAIRRKHVSFETEMFNNLRTICEVLERPKCKHILFIKRDALIGYKHVESSPAKICKEGQVNTLLYLLFKYNFNYNLREELYPVLSAIPNVSYFLNASESDYGTWLHAYNCSSGMYDPQLLKMLLDLGVDVNRADSNGMTPLIHILAIKEFWRSTVFRDAEELYVFENLDLQVHKSALVRGLRADKIFHNINPDKMPHRIGECKVYIRDSKMHGMQGHDDSDFALNFMVPFLIECGFPVMEDFLEAFDDLKDFLDPVEQVYIHNYLDSPRPLLWMCRDTLRAHYKGRQIHKFVKMANIPQQVNDFILLKPLMKCVPKYMLY